MDRLIVAKDEIAEMQEQLIEYLSAGEDAQDLTHLFTKLSIENPAAYELTLLMYQELHTKAKMDRKKITKVISHVLNHSALSYEKLIQHEVALKNKNIAQDLSNFSSSSASSASSSTPASAPAATPTSAAPQGIIGILLSPNVIYALLSTVVIIIITLVVLSMYDRELYDLILTIVKKLVGITPAVKG